MTTLKKSKAHAIINRNTDTCVSRIKIMEQITNTFILEDVQTEKVINRVASLLKILILNIKRSLYIYLKFKMKFVHH